jgi:hypothetical protein
MATFESATQTLQTGKATPSFLPIACDCILTLLAINSKSWQFNSGNLCQGLNGTVAQPANRNQSFGSGLRQQK